ncbi:hypothetical protein [Nocardia alni]|uniref:hypothetical protein n=1 Tax=Nocardia alni TaxID=2815723 RepID=UPI001C210256|nr:hypothetical protein [Nocardia alni]
MHTVVTDLQQLWRVALAALLFGAGLPTIFAVGVRFQSLSRAAVVGAPGGTNASGIPLSRRRAALAAAVACYAVVLAIVIAGVLYVAKAFIASHFGIHLFD